MPIFRSLDYSVQSTWDEIIKEHRDRIKRIYFGPKCQFYVSMQLEYEFIVIKHGIMLLTLSINKNSINCIAEIKGSNESYIFSKPVKEFIRLLQ